MSRTVNAAQMKLVEGEEGDKLELSSLMEVTFLDFAYYSLFMFGNDHSFKVTSNVTPGADKAAAVWNCTIKSSCPSLDFSSFHTGLFFKFVFDLQL